jgi:predicted transcriptional regulator
MHFQYRLPAADKACAANPLRQHRRAPALRMSEPAALAMIDVQSDLFITVTEDMLLEKALDVMFRLGVRALLAVRDSAMIGLLSIEQARCERSSQVPLPALGSDAHQRLRVADVMTPAVNVPAVEWQTVAEAQVRDLVEIFEGSGVPDIVVLESEGASSTTVRGLIHRDRLVRQLGLRSPWIGLTDEAILG